jgi:hypothetical protein
MSLMLGIVEDIEDTILLFLVCKSGVCVFSGARGSVAKGNEMRRACGTTRRAKSDGRHTAGRAAEAEAVCVCVCFPFALFALALPLWNSATSLSPSRQPPRPDALDIIIRLSQSTSLYIHLSSSTFVVSCGSDHREEKRKEPPPSLFLPSTNSVPRAGHPKQTYDSRLDNHSFRSTHFYRPGSYGCLDRIRTTLLYNKVGIGILLKIETGSQSRRSERNLAAKRRTTLSRSTCTPQRPTPTSSIISTFCSHC